MEDQINFESRIDFTDLNEKITRIRERMGKVIIGQKEVADLLLAAMLALACFNIWRKVRRKTRNQY